MTGGREGGYLSPAVSLIYNASIEGGKRHFLDRIRRWPVHRMDGDLARHRLIYHANISAIAKKGIPKLHIVNWIFAFMCQGTAFAIFRSEGQNQSSFLNNSTRLGAVA